MGTLAGNGDFEFCGFLDYLSALPARQTGQSMALKRIIASLFHASAPVSFREKIISAISAFLGILCAAFISKNLGDKAAPLLLASMGASSVLLFAAPHTPMAQPSP